MLVPPIENSKILGIIFDSCCLKFQQECTVVTVMMGGKWFKKHFNEDSSDEYFVNVAIEGLHTILGIKATPDMVKVNVSRKCIPQYIVGHKKLVKQIRSYITTHKLPLLLCGASYDGIGINDVILSAKKSVQLAVDGKMIT